jgi:prephenate dehydrogenase
VTTRRVAVIGLGLIGGSLAGALRREGVWVQGYDACQAVTDEASALGLVDSYAATLPEILDGIDAVLLCTPVAASLNLLPAVDRMTPPSTLILDTGSVKAAVLDVMEALPGGARAIGGHPLAGRETSGPAAADPDLFRGRPFVLAPSSVTSDETVNRASELAVAVGAIPRIMDAQQHDEVLARTSHLPQLLATALALCVADGDAACSGPALRDMTRLAGSDPIMWRDIFLLNAPGVVTEANQYIARLQGMVAAIAAGDIQEIERFLASGQQAGRALSGVAA